MGTRHLRAYGPDRCFAIYARSLTDDGRELDKLLITLRKFCAGRNWRVPVEYVDRQSGSTSRPREFRRMFEDARRNKIDVVVFWGLDQLSRDGAAITLNYLQQLAQSGCGWFDAKSKLSNYGVLGTVLQKFLENLASQNDLREPRRIRQRAPEERVGRGRPPLTFDLEKARRLRKEGAPFWYIQFVEVGLFNISQSTLCRKLKGVKKEKTRPYSYWFARLRSLYPDGYKHREQRNHN
jgi:DNA invertase Pin-like site-specific DNA recombinase